ncbi:MAG: tRNA guanosine(34) transglycosylase Tgt [Anaerolineaceae bacterium]|nr:tRNA guanosine(34) transglycosylase Tgt [Anaerolineaceae bacterium]
MAFEFEIIATDGHARAGILHTPHGDIPTPCFAPVGTQATVKAVPPRDLHELHASLVLANTYHLHLRPGEDLVQKMGGLHEFMQWDGPILTDSGGFQVFSLTQINKIDDEGVTFRSHIDGSQHRLTPESSMAIQEALGADIIMAFDQCPPPTDRETVEKAVARTHAWAARCREAHPDDSKQALFGIVQGGVFPDLREESAKFIQSLDLKGYAIGGLAVGETKAEQYATLEQTLQFMTDDRPRYLMGVGDPDDLCEDITRGIDIFDCVIPTRLARHGAAFTFDGRVNMKNARFKEDERPVIVDDGFESYSQNFSRAYLRHLMVAKELLGYHLLSLNNIAFLITHVQNMRQAIIEGRLAQYTDSFLKRYLGPR